MLDVQLHLLLKRDVLSNVTLKLLQQLLVVVRGARLARLGNAQRSRRSERNTVGPSTVGRRLALRANLRLANYCFYRLADVLDQHRWFEHCHVLEREEIFGRVGIAHLDKEVELYKSVVCA